MVTPRVFAPAIGVDTQFNQRTQLQELIAAQKLQTANPFGLSLFPDEMAIQNVTVNISQDELRRITQTVPFITPVVLGTVMYRIAFDTEVHQTGFIIRIQRNASARPDRSPNSIFPDEGDVPAENINLVPSIFEGGYG
jgi:hypothetical protein